MTEIPKQICSTCIYFDGPSEEAKMRGADSGRCKRRSPKIIHRVVAQAYADKRQADDLLEYQDHPFVEADATLYGEWPIVFSESWCGEWEG